MFCESGMMKASQTPFSPPSDQSDGLFRLLTFCTRPVTWLTFRSKPSICKQIFPPRAGRPWQRMLHSLSRAQTLKRSFHNYDTWTFTKSKIPSKMKKFGVERGYFDKLLVSVISLKCKYCLRSQFFPAWKLLDISHFLSNKWKKKKQ